MAVAGGNVCVKLLRCFSRFSTSTLHRNTLLRNNWRSLSTAENTDAKTEAEKPAEQISETEKQLQEEKKKLIQEVEDVMDKYKRSLAETENVRTRMQKQIKDAKLFGIQGFCKDLLEVADILNKATESIPKANLETNPALNDLYQGLTMTEQQLQKVFGRNGLVPISPEEGEKFNPNIHEALFQAPLLEGKPPGSVAIVEKIGYVLHGRTIRPALVGVFRDS